MEANEPSAGTIRATSNSIAIIEAIRRLDDARMTDIAEEIDMAKSSVHDHLYTLIDHEYVVKREDVFYLGFKFLDHGMHARDRGDVHEQAAGKVRELAEKTGEKAQFVTEEFGRGVFLYSEAGAQGVQAHTRVGSRIHLHSTASGKAILAHLPPERVDEILDKWGVPKQTGSTITDRELLRDELSEIRDRGLAYNEGENIRGVWAIGAPVRKDGDTILGAVSLSTPMSRVQDESVEKELSNALLESVNELELNIAHS